MVTARCTRADAREFGRRVVDARRRRAHRCGLRRFPVILIDHSGRPPRLKLASITLSADGENEDGKIAPVLVVSERFETETRWNVNHIEGCED